MNDKLNFLLRTAISAAVEDRDVFIENFSRFLEEYAAVDPETGARTGRYIASGLSALQNELQKESMKPKNGAKETATEENDTKLRESIEKLSRNIEELNRLLSSREK